MVAYRKCKCGLTPVHRESEIKFKNICGGKCNFLKKFFMSGCTIKIPNMSGSTVYLLLTGKYLFQYPNSKSGSGWQVFYVLNVMTM